MAASYKARLCKQFLRSSHCPYGPRCHFLHAPLSQDSPVPYTSLLALNEQALTLREAAGQPGAGYWNFYKR